MTADDRREGLDELRAARTAGVLSGDQRPDVSALGREAGNLARFGNHAARLDAEWRAVDGLADELRAEYPHLARVVAAGSPCSRR